MIGDDGFGDFVCGQCSVSVFVNEAAEGRDLFGKWYSTYTCNVNLYSEKMFRINMHSTGDKFGSISLVV